MDKSIFFLILTLSLSNSAILGQDESLKPTGNWLCQTEYGSVSLNFVSEQQMVYDGETFNYIIENNTLKVYSDYVWIDYSFELNGSQLIISYPEGYRLLFNKVSEAIPGINTGKTNSGTQNSGGRYLNGTLCEYGSSSSSSSYSSYSHTNRLYFDGRGSFQFGTESSYSGSAGSAYSNDNGSSYGTYRISENEVILTFSDGSVYTLSIYFTQDDGRITEMYYGEKLYAAGLCE